MRIIAHLEWRSGSDSEVDPQSDSGAWDNLLELMFERAIALGGRVVGWGVSSVTVDFSWDGLYDAVDFLMDAPLAPEIAAGLCCGEPTIVYDGLRLALAVGPPIRTAARLAELARPGEVLVSPTMVRIAAGRLGTAGEIGLRQGRPVMSAFILDPVNPVLESEAPARRLEGEQAEYPQLNAATHPSSSRASESERVRHVERLVTVTEALGDATPAVFPAEISTALRKRDAASLQQLAETVRSHDAFESAERLDAIAELAGGRSGEALRRLRLSKEKSRSQDGSTRCRASLALAVALSVAGRPYEAALEGLDGVGRARSVNDRRGELACARFLSQLALSLGDLPSAEAWAGLQSA